MLPDAVPAPALARARFPSGLIQPEGSYRFGLDALLLAAFALKILAGKVPKRRRGPAGRLRLVELGCGCGAALLAVAMATGAECLGIDREPELIAAAARNAVLLDVADRVALAQADLSASSFFSSFQGWQGDCDLVLANPPWLTPGEGGHSPRFLRQKAFCAAPGTLAVFCARAGGFLRNGGGFCCVLPPRLLPAFCKAIEKTGLGLRRVLPVAGQPGQAAMRILLLCQKNAASWPDLEPPLVLRSGQRGEDGRAIWTEAALAFCPWLG